MSRNEAIAILNATLERLPDAQVETLAEIAQSLADQSAEPPPVLTSAELAAIERAREDFREGRTMSAEAYNAEMDAFMVRLKTKYSVTP